MQHSTLTRNLVIILLFSSALTIGLMPSVSSQQYTTSTSFLTSSVTQTVTSYSQSYYAVTSRGTTTNTTTVQLGKVQFETSPPCYQWLISLNSTGNTHFTYTASGPMKLYFIAQGVIELLFMGGVFWPIPLVTCDTKSLAQMAGESLFGGGVVSILAPASGNFDEDLDPFQNPWMLAMVAPISPTSNVNPLLTLTYGPIVASIVTTGTFSVPLASTIAATTTLTFLTTLEVPFTQTYGGWIVAAIVAFVIAFVAAWLALRRRLRPRKQRRS